MTHPAMESRVAAEVPDDGRGVRDLWGLFDSVDGCWVGDLRGPSTFDDRRIAEIAAIDVDVVLGQSAGRTSVAPYEAVPPRKRGEVAARIAAIAAAILRGERVL